MVNLLGIKNKGKKVICGYYKHNSFTCYTYKNYNYFWLTSEKGSPNVGSYCNYNSIRFDFFF